MPLHSSPSSTPPPAQRLRVEDHLDLVWKVARRVARRLPRHVHVEELLGAGTIGLMDAVARYEPRLCNRFVPYAEIRIRGAILNQLREMDTAPRDVRRDARALDRAANLLANKFGHAPDAAELGVALHMTAASVESMRARVDAARPARACAIDEALSPGVTAEQVCINGDRRARLAAAIGDMPADDRRILSRYYVEDLNLREIGALLDVTESRACQRVHEIARKLGIALANDC